MAELYDLLKHSGDAILASLGRAFTVVRHNPWVAPYADPDQAFQRDYH